MATMTRSNFPSLMSEGLRQVFFEWLDIKSLVYPEIYETATSKKKTESDQTIAGLDMMSAKAEGEPTLYDSMVEGYDKSYTHTTFSKGVRSTQELIEDELYGVLGKRAKALANSARYRLEYDHASIFNNATTATSPYDVADGLALLSTAHTLAGSSGNTYANSPGSTDISLSALEAAVTAFRRMKNDRNLLVSITPATLLIPPELEFDAMEMLESTGKAYTADNEINSLRGRFKIVIWDFITDTDSWFLLADKRYGAPVSFKRVPLSFRADVDFDTDDIKQKCRTRYSYGATDWRWVYGSLGG